MNENYFGLMKFSKEKYSDLLLKQGNLKFSTLEYFQDTEKEKVEKFRYDKYEGTSEIINSLDLKKITLDGRDFQTAISKEPIRIKSGLREFSHICCFNILTAKWFIDKDGIKRGFDPRLFEFGDTLVIIPHPQIQNGFFTKLKNYFKSNNIFFKAGPVKYIDYNNYTGQTGEFVKNKCFSYQIEFRVAISLNTSDDYFINLGNLEDIAFKVKKNECKNIVQDETLIIK